MPLQSIPLASNLNEDRSKPVSTERIVNMYPERPVQPAKSELVLKGTPGLKAWKSFDGDVIRGMMTYSNGGDESLFVLTSGSSVLDNSAYIIQSNGLTTKLNSPSGTLDVKGFSTQEWNGFTATVVTGTEAYIVRDWRGGPPIYTPYKSIIPHTGVDGGGIRWQCVTFLDGYFLMSVANDDSFYIAVNDGTVVFEQFRTPVMDLTDFTLANTVPDNIVTMKAVGREVWVLCETSTQIYYDSGQADFPFTRLPAGVLNVGCIASHSAAVVDGRLFWLANDLSVRMTDGYNPRVVSSPPVEKWISDLSSGSHKGAIAFGYIQDGHVFYVLTFPDELTIVYDASLGVWHQRKSYNRDDWRVRTYAYFQGKHLVGDGISGNVYELDMETYDEIGDPVTREAVTPPIHAGGNRAFMKELILDIETGVGLVSGQGSNPQIMMQYSDDGGRTWSSERWISIGAIGDYSARARWTRLGSFRQRVFRFTLADPVKFTAIGAYADMTVGVP